ncbi:Abi family protein [Ligilactobacillus sp. WILCCON 0076]|uniref:Abi family protein n=1 Tax=Ligilactobacillus ubinensis TaxID=2876789 RepID=A0A9X2FLZ8_9LACO|nr:Abi family protein [Ligilactobacillus ubinensis]MCP0886973.1 Abi family protein [Ligilactobacillus ubinensis]
MQNRKQLNDIELLNKAFSQFANQPDKEALKVYLSNLSYFDLIKGYKKTILKTGNNKFLDNLSIDILYHIHWLDSSLSNLLLKYSLETEKHLKSELSKIICNYGESPKQYLRPTLYSNRNSSILSKLNKDICNNPNSDIAEKFEKYKEKNGCLPAWYLIQHLSFGRIINWYSILKEAPKSQITQNFMDEPSRLNLKLEDKKELFKSFLNYSLEVRNKAAHGNRILNIKIRERISKNRITSAGLSDYFKLDANGRIVLSNIVNFIAITILLTGIPIFSINALNEFINFFAINSHEETDVLSKINITIYELFDINHDDLDRLKSLVEYRFGMY